MQCKEGRLSSKHSNSNWVKTVLAEVWNLNTGCPCVHGDVAISDGSTHADARGRFGHQPHSRRSGAAASSPDLGIRWPAYWDKHFSWRGSLSRPRTPTPASCKGKLARKRLSLWSACTRCRVGDTSPIDVCSAGATPSTILLLQINSRVKCMDGSWICLEVSSRFLNYQNIFLDP